jgi:hypothetical protein
VIGRLYTIAMVSDAWSKKLSNKLLAIPPSGRYHGRRWTPVH